MKIRRLYLCAALLGLVQLLCVADDDLLYVNENYCFSAPRLQFSEEELSQDGTGVTFSMEKGCAEAPVWSCDKMSLYAEYAIADEQSRKDWFEDLNSAYIKEDWHVDARSVVLIDHINWHVSTFSKMIGGRRIEAVAYQTYASKSSPPVIYGVHAVFAGGSRSKMRLDINKAVRGFKYESACK